MEIKHGGKRHVYTLINRLQFLEIQCFCHNDSNPWFPAYPYPAQYIGICCLIDQALYLLFNTKIFLLVSGSYVVWFLSTSHSYHALILWNLLKTQTELLTKTLTNQHD